MDGQKGQLCGCEVNMQHYMHILYAHNTVTYVGTLIQCTFECALYSQSIDVGHLYTSCTLYLLVYTVSVSVHCVCWCTLYLLVYTVSVGVHCICWCTLSYHTSTKLCVNLMFANYMRGFSLHTINYNSNMLPYIVTFANELYNIVGCPIL